MNYWWLLVLLVLILVDDLRLGIFWFLQSADTWVLFCLFILALAWWSKSK